MGGDDGLLFSARQQKTGLEYTRDYCLETYTHKRAAAVAFLNRLSHPSLEL